MESAPTVMTPYRQSRVPSHITPANSSAIAPPHQITGVPISSTCR